MPTEPGRKRTTGIQDVLVPMKSIPANAVKKGERLIEGPDF